LVDGPERERVEDVQLSNTGEVEERVAVERRSDVPERDPERDSAERDEPASRSPEADPSTREHTGDDRDPGVEPEREPDRPLHPENEEGREAERGEAPDQRRRGGPLAERAGDEPTGQEQAERRRGESQPEPEAVVGEEPRDPKERDHPEPGEGEPHRWSRTG